MSAVTQWFAPNTQPSRPGEYEVFMVGMRFWNGSFWVNPSGLKVWLLNPWRGLADRPAANQQANTEKP
jgi:hypothetical protein